MIFFLSLEELPGTWSPLPDTPAGLRPAIICPECRQKSVLYDHEISGSGEISPMVECPFCRETYPVRLADWGKLADLLPVLCRTVKTLSLKGTSSPELHEPKPVTLVELRYGQKHEFEYDSLKEAAAAWTHTYESDEGFPERIIGPNGETLWQGSDPDSYTHLRRLAGQN